MPTIVAAMTEVGTAISGSAETLDPMPDAGRSSDEIAVVLGNLAGLIDSLGGYIAALGDAADQANVSYLDVDDAVRERFYDQKKNFPSTVPRPGS